MSTDEVERLKRRLKRERSARKQAEQLLEEKSLALFVSNQDLRKAHDELEKRVQDRTQALLESEEKFRRFIEVATDVIYQTDVRGFFTYANPVAMKVLRLTGAEEIVGRHYSELVHPEDRTLLAELYQEQLQNKVKGTYQEFRLNRGNHQRPVWIGQNVQLIFADDKVVGFQAVARDITDLKSIQSQLKQQRDFAEQILNSMGQGLTLTNQESRFIYVNPAFANMLGYTAEELMNQSLIDYIHPDDIESLYNARIQLVHEAPPSYEIHFIAKDKATVPVLVTGVPRWHNNEPIGFIDTIVDLTERKEMEQALREARDQALEASRMQSSFLANMSHEIRTPLNGVLGMAELLGETELDEEQREFIDIINTSSVALLSIINDILDFSKITKGKIDLENRSFDLRETVEASLDVLASNAGQKGLELAYVMASDVPHLIVGDEARLRQIFINLLSNAVKFTSKGEVVLLVTKVMSPEGRPQIQFAVRDTGIGISQEAQERLFQAFYQADFSTTRNYGGTGLGLAICKELAHLMGGRIWLESEVGFGSTFYFTIDLQMTPNYVHQRPALVPELIGKQLLIVESHGTNREILRSQAKKLGMTAHLADSHEAALRLLQNNLTFDFAILALSPHELVEGGLADEIRRRPQYHTLPLVWLSFMGNRLPDSTKDRFIHQMNKPIKASSLRQVALAVLEEVEAQQRRLAEAPRVASDQAIQILLAEDNVVNQKVIKNVLSHLGYDADIVFNGRQVIDALENRYYDLILMDIQMPEIDGIQATELIRERFPADHQPFIVAVTASAIQGDRERFIAAGMNEYLSKPIRMVQLSQLLQDFEGERLKGEG